MQATIHGTNSPYTHPHLPCYDTPASPPLHTSSRTIPFSIPAPFHTTLDPTFTPHPTNPYHNPAIPPIHTHTNQHSPPHLHPQNMSTPPSLPPFSFLHTILNLTPPIIPSHPTHHLFTSHFPYWPTIPRSIRPRHTTSTDHLITQPLHRSLPHYPCI